MNNLKDILRERHNLSLSHEDVTTAIRVSAGTVSNVLEWSEAARLSC